MLNSKYLSSMTLLQILSSCFPAGNKQATLSVSEAILKIPTGMLAFPGNRMRDGPGVPMPADGALKDRVADYRTVYQDIVRSNDSNEVSGNGKPHGLQIGRFPRTTMTSPARFPATINGRFRGDRKN